MKKIITAESYDPKKPVRARTAEIEALKQVLEPAGDGLSIIDGLDEGHDALVVRNDEGGFTLIGDMNVPESDNNSLLISGIELEVGDRTIAYAFVSIMNEDTGVVAVSRLITGHVNTITKQISLSSGTYEFNATAHFILFVSNGPFYAK